MRPPSAPLAMGLVAALVPSVLDVPHRETTHISTADAAGNLGSYTCSIKCEGGNGMVVPGYGFLLNNELAYFGVPPAPPLGGSTHRRGRAQAQQGRQRRGAPVR